MGSAPLIGQSSVDHCGALGLAESVCSSPASRRSFR